MRLIIDAQGIAWACAHRLKIDRGKDRKPRDLAVDGMKTGAIYGTLRTLEHLMQTLEPTEMIVCWDRRCHRRYAAYPDYKLHRQPENLDPEAREFREDVERQIDDLRHILTYLPVIQIEEPGAEADDCIGMLGAFLKLEHVGIVTSDYDLYQLAHKRIERKQALHEIYNRDGTPAEMEFTPKQYLIYKVLVGDTSDHIKGVLGVGDKTTRKLIREHRTLKRIMKAAKKAGRFGRRPYDDAEEIVKRNLKLMIPGLLHTEEERRVVINRYQLDRLERTMTSAKELRKAFTHYKFTSLISRLSSFMQNFQPLVRTRHDKATPIPKAWEAMDADHPARRSRSVRQENDQMRRTRIVRKTAPRSTKRSRSRRGRHTRIVRRTVKASDGDSAPAILADARWSDDDGSITAVSTSIGGKRPTGRKTTGVGSGGIGEHDQAHADATGRGSEPEADQTRQATRAEQTRSLETMIRMRALAQDPQWPEGQTVKVLNFVRILIRRYETDPGFVPTTQAAAWMRELHHEWSFAMPGWMKVPSDDDKPF